VHVRRAGTAALAVSLLSVAPLAAIHASSAAFASTTSVRAVVLLQPGAHPARPAGGRVVAAFPAIGSEVVTAPAASLHRLARNPSVAGISPDWTGRVAGWKGKGNNKDTAGVLAPQVVGGAAGEPGTGAGATVALLDTGVSNTAAINRSSGRLIDGVDTTNLSSTNDGQNEGPLTDGYGHGTFMASLIAGGVVPGSGNRAIGIAPAAHIVVVKVANSDGRTRLSNVLAGLNWVALHHSTIQIVNLSLAVPRPTAPAYGADPLNAAIEKVRAAGVLPVAAVGNTPHQVGDPGMDPEALTAGAADVSKRHAAVSFFSGSGVVDGVVKPDVVAPGQHVLGVIAHGSVIARHNPQGWDKTGLFRGSGTSEATAVTSGIAAAYVAAHRGASPLAVKTAIRQSALRMCTWGSGAGLASMGGGTKACNGRDKSGVDTSTDPSGESSFDATTWQNNSWLHGAWVPWLASSWSASSWSASSWSASSWSASSWSASSWSASSWSASSWSARSWGG
jgi:serine protease AprX